MIQKTIFKEITKKLTPHQRLADVVSSVLKKSTDSSYRRIRGETELTLSEAFKLCSYFNISFDSIVKNQRSSVIFRYNTVDFSHLNSYHRYIQEFTETVSAVSNNARGGEIYYTAEDVPLFHFLRFHELTFFKIYVWHNAVSSDKITFEQFMKGIRNKKQFFDDFNSLENSYCKTASREIWTDDTIYHILRLLDYYCDMGAFEEKETVGLLFRQLNEMTDRLKEWTESGKKEDKGDFKLYYSAVNPENNFVLLKNEENTAVAIRLYTVKSIVTSNPSFCEETEKWIGNIMINSTLLSETSARERRMFFQNMKAKIDALQTKIDLDSRG